MDFFTRAKILSQVDNHIASKRHLSSQHQDINKELPKENYGDQFFLLADMGIDRKLIDKIYRYFIQFDFKYQSSVGQKVNFLDKTVFDTYDKLRTVNLYDHTLRVVSNALNDKEVEVAQRPLVGLFALLHDTGKSEKLCDYFGIKFGDGHERASAEFVQIILHQTPYEKLGKMFSDDLILIYDVKSKNKPFEKLGFYGAALHRSDVLARVQELEIFEEKKRKNLEECSKS